MAIPILTYIPLLTTLIEHACNLITKHQQKMKDVVATVAPAEITAFNAALDSVVAACVVFQNVLAALRIYQAAH